MYDDEDYYDDDAVYDAEVLVVEPEVPIPDVPGTRRSRCPLCRGHPQCAVCLGKGWVLIA